MKTCRMLVSVFVLILLAASVVIASEKRVLGVKSEPITMQEAKKLALPCSGGLKVIDIKPGSPADKAGIKKDDILLTLNGIELNSLDALDEAVDKSPLKGKLLIWRNGWEKPFDVEFPEIKKPEVAKAAEEAPEVSDDLLEEMKKAVEAQKREYERLKKLYEKMQEKSLDKGDKLKKEESAPERKESKRADGKPFLGISVLENEDNKDVSVSSVEKNSPAEKFGLKVGDVIVEVNGSKIRGINSLQGILAKSKPGDLLKIVVNRNGQKMQVNLELGTKG